MTDQATVYRWETMAGEHPMELLTRKRVIGSQMMISHVVLRTGCRVPSHRHANEQFACILSGSLRFGLGEEGTEAHRFVTVGAGEVLHLPSNVPHSAEALEETTVLDLFSPPSATTGIDRA